MGVSLEPLHLFNLTRISTVAGMASRMFEDVS